LGVGLRAHPLLKLAGMNLLASLSLGEVASALA